MTESRWWIKVETGRTYAMLLIGFLPLELSIGFSFNRFCLFRLSILDYNDQVPSIVTIFGIEFLAFWFDLAYLEE